MNRSRGFERRIRSVIGTLALPLMAYACMARAEEPAKAPEKAPETAAPATPPETAAPPKVDAPADTVSDQDVVIIIGGQPTPGKAVLPASETEFKYKLADSGVIVTLRWSDLADGERQRVQKIYGVVIQGSRKVVGEKVQGLRLQLESGKTIEGMHMAERDRNGFRAIKTPSSLQMIPDREIKSQEAFDADIGDFMSSKEIYDRWMNEKPPGQNDAAAHYAMAQKAANIGLMNKALEHLQMAAVIDPRTEERYKDFRTQIIADNAKQQSWDMYTRMVQARNSGDFYTAWDILEQLDRNFPNSEYKSRWEGLRTELENGTKNELTKRVVQMSYGVALDLLQKQFYKKVKIDDKGNVVPSIPGKLVTTKQGRIFKGKLIDSPSEGDVVLKVGDTAITITGKDIMSVQDVDLSTSNKLGTVTYDDLKDFITDLSRPDGLKTLMIARLAQMLKQPEAKVKEIFDNRLERTGKYENGDLKMTTTFATLHDAYWGKGSWLRDGSQPAQVKQIDNPQNVKGNRKNDKNNNNGGGLQTNAQTDPKDNPDLTDDPLVWWKYQDSTTQMEVLKAMAAEKVFGAKEVLKSGCPTCHGTSEVPAYNSSGTLSTQRCPNCRGMGFLFRIIYH